MRTKMVKNHRKVNALLISLFLLLILGLIYTTYAFHHYSTTLDLENILFTQKGTEVYLQELFSQDDLWLPGETKIKEVWFGNQSDIDQVIRFTIDIEWFDAYGNPWSYMGIYNTEPVVINWTSEIIGISPTWTKIGDYWYYNLILEKQNGSTPTETQPIMNSVTFSPEISNSDYYYGDDFSDKFCKITIQMEALPVNANSTGDVWGVTFIDSEGTLIWTVVD